MKNWSGISSELADPPRERKMQVEEFFPCKTS
jgi:hypothetical protein